MRNDAHPRQRRGLSWAPALAVGIGSAGATACGGGDVAGWAVQHATVDVSSSGVSGYQVWEIFDRRWDDRQNSRHHLCAVVQQVEGGLVADFEGCDGCEASYELEVDLLETDCPADTVDPSVFSGVRGYGFGEVPSELRDADPDPGRSVGWYVSWDGQQAEALGFATPEDDTVDATGWQVDTRYELVPAVAWEL